MFQVPWQLRAGEIAMPLERSRMPRIRRAQTAACEWLCPMRYSLMADISPNDETIATPWRSQQRAQERCPGGIVSDKTSTCAREWRNGEIVLRWSGGALPISSRCKAWWGERDSLLLCPKIALSLVS